MTHKSLLPHLYETVVEEALFGIAVFDENGLCIYTNRMARDLLGSEQPQLAKLAPHNDEQRTHMKGFSPDFLKHDGLYQDILVRNETGGTFIATIGVRTLHVDNFRANLLTFQDVTLQKKLQREIIAKQNEIKIAFEELLQQNKKLRDLDLAKDRFIALTTHELRTPLSAMVASAELLKLGLFDKPEQMQEFITMIYDQGLQLQDLVNDILDFAKIQAGKMDFYIELQDPVALTQNIMRNFQSMAETKSVTLHLDTPQAPLSCYFDDVRLRQVLSNMINNAIKYNRSGGSVTISFHDDKDRIKISVTDTGKGIPEDQFGKVFNEFETVGQIPHHQKGTGLGMPISRKLAEGMGGTLDFKSTFGVGSTFWVDLPKDKVMDPSLYRPRPEKSGDYAA